MRTVIVLSLMLATLPAAAGVYRWTDDKGVVHYSDNAPNPNAQPADLPKLQTFDSKSLTKGAPIDNGSTAATADSSAVKPDDVRPIIMSPDQDETIRDVSNGVTISVKAPGNPSLVYYYDGKRQNDQPTASTSYLIDNVERGTHTLEVAAVDPNGKEIVRSAKVTIPAMPPSVIAPGGKKKGH